VKQPLILIAASGLAREVMATVDAAGTHEVVGVVDDSLSLHGSRAGETKVLGGTELVFDHPDAQLVVCVGAGRGREGLVRRLGDMGVGDERFATVVHPTAVVPSNCDLGVGTVLLAHVVLTADVTVGRHVVMMPASVLTHDDVVEDFATLCAGVVLGGGVQVGRAAYLGMNCSVRQDLRVGGGSVLGMGSVLLEDLPDGQTWVGAPARPLNQTSRALSPDYDGQEIVERPESNRLIERTAVS
jgi:sugar O-acyltransferase (sialic acid O-acetyltransferase NeuD family)